MLTRSLPVVFGVMALVLWLKLKPVAHPPGILVENPPAALSATAMPLPSREGAGEYLLHRVARVHAQGRVLAVQRYRDEAAALAPVDVVIGWGRMSDSQVISGVTVHQRSRSYRLEWSGTAPLSSAEAMSQTVNLHLIPGTPEMAQFVGRLKRGQLVDLRGALTEAVRDHRRWAGSLVEEEGEARTDLYGSRLLFLSEAHTFKGRSRQDLRARAFHDQEALRTADLHLWFESLKRRRQTLDVDDALAVREFNREAARYMSIAHPKPTTAPAALRQTPPAPVR